PRCRRHNSTSSSWAKSCRCDDTSSRRSGCRLSEEHCFLLYRGEKAENGCSAGFGRIALARINGVVAMALHQATPNRALHVTRGKETRSRERTRSAYL